MFTACRTCINLPGPKNRPGFYFTYTKHHNSEVRSIVECKCHKRYKHKKLVKIRSAKANLWANAIEYDILRDYHGTKSKDNTIRIHNYVNRFDEDDFKKAVVYMYGANGTQKTTIGHYIGTQLVYDHTVKFLSMNELVILLTHFTNGQEEEEKRRREVQRLVELDLLILDESFSRDKVTVYKSGFQLPALDQFLRTRIERHGKGVVFISNSAPDQIEAQGFNRSLQDLIIRNTKPFSTALTFDDNYLQTLSDFDIKDLFG